MVRLVTCGWWHKRRVFGVEFGADRPSCASTSLSASVVVSKSKPGEGMHLTLKNWSLLVGVVIVWCAFPLVCLQFLVVPSLLTSVRVLQFCWARLL